MDCDIFHAFSVDVKGHGVFFPVFLLIVIFISMDDGVLSIVKGQGLLIVIEALSGKVDR